MRASIQSRTRSRTPVSIGSIQSSKSRASGCPVGCTECDLLIRSVMAWSPTGPERSKARIPLCGLQHPETTPPSKVYHLPDGTVGDPIRALCCTIRDPWLSTVCAVIRREQYSPVIESHKVCRGGNDVAC